jgi:hypothetical protein
MFYQTETKLQGWRALVVFEDRGECLLYVGRSTTQVRAGYVTAFAEVLDEEERSRVRGIFLQCWQGAADKGRWVQKAILAIPRGQSAAAPAGPGQPAVSALADASGPRTATILPFRGTPAASEKEGQPIPLVLPLRKAVAARAKGGLPSEAPPAGVSAGG